MTIPTSIRDRVTIVVEFSTGETVAIVYVWLAYIIFTWTYFVLF